MFRNVPQLSGWANAATYSSEADKKESSNWVLFNIKNSTKWTERKFILNNTS